MIYNFGEFQTAFEIEPALLVQASCEVFPVFFLVSLVVVIVECTSPTDFADYGYIERLAANNMIDLRVRVHLI